MVVKCKHHAAVLGIGIGLSAGHSFITLIAASTIPTGMPVIHIGDICRSQSQLAASTWVKGSVQNRVRSLLIQIIQQSQSITSSQ